MPPKPPSSVAVPEAVEEAGSTPSPGAGPSPVSLAGLGIAGLSRRRVGIAATALVTIWIVISFAGQASEAARAAQRAVQEQATNEALVAHVAALRDELSLVQTQRWILQQARAYGLGSKFERPFVLAPGTSPLPADAPGSAVRRLGTSMQGQTPLESWLVVLFGSGTAAGE
jgi:hypothetical protein